MLCHGYNNMALASINALLFFFDTIQRVYWIKLNDNWSDFGIVFDMCAWSVTCLLIAYLYIDRSQKEIQIFGVFLKVKVSFLISKRRKQFKGTLKEKVGLSSRFRITNLKWTTGCTMLYTGIDHFFFWA